MRTCLFVSLSLFALASACIERDVSEVQPEQSREIIDIIPVHLESDLDLLFVIDNSGSMTEEQASLAANFDRFINVLSTIEGLGLPNLHLGVVSTDLGAGPYSIAGCSADGDDGVLQNAPREATCSPPAGAFISDIDDGAGGRATNYQGDLADAFSCIAKLGADGCGFEQPLEAMRRALDGSNPENAGFLRDGALLGVVFITDEDDCSASDTAVFDTAQTGLDDPLGPLSSHRCFEFGVVCEPDSPRTTGERLSCKPREDSPYIEGVQQYVDFLRGLKDDPRRVAVAGIIGPPEPVVIGTDANGAPQLDPSCQSASGSAAPGIRLAAFLDGFPDRNTAATICNADLSDALVQIAKLLERIIGDPCLPGDLVEPVQCEVSQVLDYQLDGQTEVRLPRCADDSGTGATSDEPCWVIYDNADCAAKYPSGLAIKVFPEERDAPLGTDLVVRCLGR